MQENDGMAFYGPRSAPRATARQVKQFKRMMRPRHDDWGLKAIGLGLGAASMFSPGGGFIGPGSGGSGHLGSKSGGIWDRILGAGS